MTTPYTSPLHNAARGALRLGGALGAAALIIAGIPSCADDVETSGEAITYSVQARGVTGSGGDPAAPFTTASGWTITLEEARVLVGPIYMYSGEARASLWPGLLGTPSAYACAADAQFQSGLTLGAISLQYGVDLLGGPVEMAEVSGVAGEVRSIELHLQNPGEVEPGNELAREQRDHTVHLRGVARRDDQEINFSGAMTLPEEGTYQIVDSIPAEVTLRQGGVVGVQINVSRWLDALDFSELDTDTTTSPNEVAPRMTIAPGTRAYSALSFTLRSRGAFTLREVTP